MRLFSIVFATRALSRLAEVSKFMASESAMLERWAQQSCSAQRANHHKGWWIFRCKIVRHADKVWNPYSKLDLQEQESTNQFGLRSILETCCLSNDSLSNEHEDAIILKLESLRTKLADDSDEERVTSVLHAPCTHGNWNAWTFRHGIRLGPRRVETKILKFLSPVMILSCWAQRNCIELHRPCSHGKLTKQLFEVACARARLRSSLEPKWLRKNITIIVHMQHSTHATTNTQKTKNRIRTHTGCLCSRTFPFCARALVFSCKQNDKLRTHTDYLSSHAFPLGAEDLVNRMVSHSRLGEHETNM